jgi:hypothetical protein
MDEQSELPEIGQPLTFGAASESNILIRIQKEGIPWWSTANMGLGHGLLCAAAVG